MNIESITSIIESYISASIDDKEIENPKTDFKRKWYSLSTENDISEFCKDVSAIANTVGLDGYLVIGYDIKEMKFYETKIKDSGKNDIEIKNLLNKYISEDINVNLFDINIKGNNLVVIHIPPQFNKPFVVKNYKKDGKDNLNRIYVRSGTSNKIANKYDLDFIYYDKKNLIPEIGFNVFLQRLSLNSTQSSFTKIFCSLAIENYGIKPIAIQRLTIPVEYEDKIIELKITENSDERGGTGIYENPLIINPGNFQKYGNLVGHIIPSLPSLLIDQISKTPKFIIDIELIDENIYKKKIKR